MKKTFLIIFTLLILSTFCIHSKQRVAVLNFSTKGNIKKYLSEAVTENFTVTLIETNEFIVIERSEIDKIFLELKLQNTDDFDDKLALDIGHMAGAEIVILGSIALIGKSYSITAKGINVKTGTAEFAKKLSVDSEDELLDTVDNLAYLIAGKKTYEDTISPEKQKKMKQNEYRANINSLNKKEKDYYERDILGFHKINLTSQGARARLLGKVHFDLAWGIVFITTGPLFIAGGIAGGTYMLSNSIDGWGWPFAAVGVGLFLFPFSSFFFYHSHMKRKIYKKVFLKDKVALKDINFGYNLTNDKFYISLCLNF